VPGPRVDTKRPATQAGVGVGTHYANDCTFLEASPQRIVIRHVTAPHFTLTITLTEADGQTRLDWRQAFDDPRVATAVASIVVPANEQNLNRLPAVLLASAESSAFKPSLEQEGQHAPA
jgi:hypothetical protein